MMERSRPRPLTFALVLALALPSACDAANERAAATDTTPTTPSSGSAPNSDPEESQSAPSPQAPPASLEGSHVVVAAGSLFYASASAQAPLPTRSYMSDEVEQGSIAARHLGWTMALGEVEGERAEVRVLPGGDPARACGHGMAGLEHFALSFWVERSALLPVSTAIAQLRYADGSSVWLPPGIPILPADESQPRRLSAWGFELGIEEASHAGGGELATGFAFNPTPLPPLETEASEAKADALFLAGGPLPRAHFFAPAAEVAQRELEGQRLVRIRGRCIDVEAVARPAGEAPVELGSLGSIGLGGGYGPNNSSRFLGVPAGTAVHWPDGSPAGSVREPLRLLEPKAPGEGTCVYVSVGNGQQDIPLCFAPADIEVLTLGKLELRALEIQSGAEAMDLDPARVLRMRVLELRETCLSHALERDPNMQASWALRINAGAHPEPPKVTLRRLSGPSDDELQRCIREHVEQWRDARLAQRNMRFELHAAPK